MVSLQGPLSTEKWSPWVFPFHSLPSVILTWLTPFSLFKDPEPSEWNETFQKSSPSRPPHLHLSLVNLPAETNLSLGP